MMSFVRNATLLGVLALTAACGMMEDSSKSASNNQGWFQYAYYSSPVNFDHDDASGQPLKVKPLKLQ